MADERPGPLRAVAIGVAIIVAFGVLHAAAKVAPYLLLGFFGVVIATVLSWPVGLFARVMPRTLATLLTLFIFVGGVVSTGWLLAPTLARQFNQLSQDLPNSAAKIKKWWRHQSESGPIAQLPNPPAMEKQVEQKVGEVVKQAPAIALNGVEILTGIVVVLALGFFLVAEPHSYVRGIAALTPARHRPAVESTLHLMGLTLRRWTGGIFIAMLLMGTLTAIGLRLVGVDAWLTLGLITFVGTFVPYAGALASALPGLAVALAHSPHQFFWVGVVYVAVHHVEGYLVEPLVMRRAVELRPGVLLVWQVVMGALFGPIGVIVATPFLCCVKVAINHLWVERVGGLV